MRLEREDQFIELELNSRRLAIREGATGTAGAERVKIFWFEARARSAYRRLIVAAQAEGYREGKRLVIPATFEELVTAGLREPQLEAAIRADREDPAAYDVYADWLQQHGEPHGELIALQRARETPANQKRIDELVLAMRLADDRFTCEWRWGFWHSLLLDPGDDKVDVPALAAHAFGQTSCAVLAELRIGSLRWESNHLDIPKVITAAASYPWARDLESLLLGEVEDIDMAHHLIGRVGVPISRSFPRLRRLSLHSGDSGTAGDDDAVFRFDGLDLPELEELTIETCSFSLVHLEHLFAAKLPKLRKLVIWFGSEEYGCDVELADLAPLLANKIFPNLDELGLCNALFADQLARTIHTTAIAPQLLRLDLSMGTLDDASAIALAGNADAFELLEELSVDDSFLTIAGVRAVKAAFPTVYSASQREVENGNVRFVSVWE